MLAPWVRGERREAANASPSGARGSAKAAAIHRGDVDHIAVAPGSLGPRGPRAFRSVLYPDYDLVVIIEDSVAVTIIDLARQFQSHVGRRGALDELVTMDAHLRDRGARGIAVGRQI